MNTIAIDQTRNHRWVVANGYRIRIILFALAGLPIALHILPERPGFVVWALFVLQFLIYPHLLRWFARNSGAQERAALNSMIIDAVLCGAWASGLGFPLLISFGLFLANLLNHTITRGVPGIFVCSMAFISGALAATTVIAFRVSSDTSGLVTLVTIIGIAAYLSLIGIEIFAYTRQLHQVQDSLDSQKKSLEAANAILHEQIAKIQDLQEKLREQANRDSLTGLFNRRYLEGTLQRELARCKREGAALSMLLFDIDHFKLINDTYGHQAGDEVLRVFGQLLLEHARTEDIVCRYGGEEFLVVLPKMPLDIARERGTYMLKLVAERTVAFAALRIRITTSIGVATAPQHSDSAEGLVRCADEALYLAKHSGRNQLVTFGDEMPPGGRI